MPHFFSNQQKTSNFARQISNNLMAESKVNSRSTKFIKDFGIYAIGNLGSKIITTLMLPLYTYFVEKPNEYGYFDLCLQISLLMTPIITLQLRDGAFRFLLETNDSQKRSQIISFVYRTIFFSIISTVSMILIVSMFTNIEHLWLIIMLMIVIAIDEIIAQISRGLGKNTVFVSMGLICAFSTGFFSLIFLAWLRLGIIGIFLSTIIARLTSTIYGESKTKTLSCFFSLKTDMKHIGKDLIRYCLPLIPVTLCNFVPPLSDRLFLLYFWDLKQAGIYGIAVRLSGIIHNLAIIFYQTWQENAIQQYNSSDRDHFFSKVFNGYIFVLVFVLIGSAFTIKICSWIIGPNYQSGLQYLYLLGVSMILAAISNYFYLPYQCAKDTKAAIPAVIILAICNVVMNLILVPTFGIYGVVFTAILSYTIANLYLFTNTKKYFKLHFYSRSLIPIALVVVSIIPYSFITNHYLDAAYVFVTLVILILILPKHSRKGIFLKIKNKVVHRKGTIL